MSGSAAAHHHRGTLDRLLSVFAEVRSGEGLTAILLMIDVFLLLTCYYIVKPVREALILSSPGGAELKSYAAAGMAVLLVFVVPAYGAFASRVDRARLISWVTVFFIACLLAFVALGRAHTPFLGIVFFLWVGIFNLMIIAQFWSFANDVYTPEQGKRLFAIVAFGSSLGAIVGSWIAKPLIGSLGPYPPLLIGAAMLLLSILLTRAVHGREHQAHDVGGRVTEAKPLGRESGFKLVLAQRYLLLIALLMVVLNFVNTNGEYILGKTLSAAAEKLAAAGQTGGLAPDDFKGKYIGQFYAGFFTWVNVLSALLQLFVVSRFMKWFGVRAALFVLPVIALGGYALLATTTAIRLIRAVKIAENSIDYSLQNTARQALFLPTSREAKYKAKSAIDTFFVRMGDVLSGILVFIVSSLSLPTTVVAIVNIALVGVWLWILTGISREHRKLAGDAETAPAGAATASA